MHLKLLLENNKKNFLLLLSFQPSAAQNALKTGSAQLSSRALAAPRLQPGPGPAKCRAPSRPPGPAMARGSMAVGFDRTVTRRLRPDQNQRRAGGLKTLGHSALPLSLSSLFLSSLFSRSSEPQPRAKERRASGPLRCRRPPRRCACSPTGEHAAIERPGHGASLAEPGEPAPPARLLLPRRRKSSSDAP